MRMTFLTSSLIAVFSVVAAIHTLWGFGFWFPLRDEAKLVRSVVGAKDATRMPGPIPCALVAGALVAVVMSLTAEPSCPRDILLGLAALVLILRGLLSWVPLWRRMAPREPFATLDRYAYGPLSLLLGLGLIRVIIG